MKPPIPIHLPALPAPGHPHFGPPVSPQKSRAFDQQTTALGSRVIGVTLGGGAVVLGVVSAVWLMSFGWALARSPGEGVRLVLVALACAAILGGLPIASAVLSRNYPHESELAMRAWRWLLLAAAICVGGLTFSLPAPVSSPADARPRFMPVTVWRYSHQCRAPENDYQADVCDHFRTALAGSGTASNALISLSGSPFGRLAVVLFGIAAIAGAGQMARFAVLAMAESQRLIGGEAQAMDIPENTQVQPVMIPDVPLTPLQIFDMWFNGRIRFDQQGKLSASGAYEDYKVACQMNGYAALSQKKFGDILTAKATNSGGRISKQMTNGSNFYNGLALVGDRMPMDINADSFSAMPHRT